ncbi:MAG: inosine/xanthosine triphosphatase [Bacteroidota bacterium]
MKVIVGSTNPVKINSTKAAFEAAFPDEEFEVEGVSVVSDVRDQPLSNDETLLGAKNRAFNAQAGYQADFWVGIEGGIEDHEDELEAFAWMVVLGANGTKGKARTSSFVLPHEVSILVRAGLELGQADDQVFNQTHSKQKTGAVGLLTNNIIVRSEYYKQAIILALVPFLKPEFY